MNYSNYNNIDKFEKKRKDRNLFDFTNANELEDNKNDISQEEMKSPKEEIKELNKHFKEEIELKKKENYSKDIPPELKEILFPYEKVRDEQERLIKISNYCINNKKHLLAHAPTGLGKTVSVIAPALNYAIKNNKQVLFLTSRHTQHLIAMKTAKDIHNAHNINFIATDIIGKKWMCLNSAARNSSSNDFAEICKYLRKNNTCKFYTNTIQNSRLTIKAIDLIETIKTQMNDTNKIIEISQENEMCPYEISLALAKESQLIITDYYYTFNQSVMDNFFRRAQLMLENCIVIVDEAHNLPQRIREQQSSRLTTNMVKRAINEAKKISNEQLEKKLNYLSEILEDFSEEIEEQRQITNYNSEKKKNINSLMAEILLKKEDFEFEVKVKTKYDELVKELEQVGENIRDANNSASYIYIISKFLEKWRDIEDESYIRILKKEGKNIILNIKCLDPSVTSSNIINNTHSTILMSGTLEPTQMYHDFLGLEKDRTVQKSFNNPFPKKNRLNIIIPRTTTKYQKRSDEQFQEIGEICSELTNKIKGNNIIFFPSYIILKKVYTQMKSIRKTIIMENQEMSRDEKFEILETFKKYHKTGACLLAVQSGSFYEGIDLPGELLKGVLIVGLPLQKPDLETRQLINYYDLKFNKGWDYGYVFPAFSKILQSAGRCIRSAEDKGVIAFIDERYDWPNYKRCFPTDWELESTHNYLERIDEFYN